MTPLLIVSLVLGAGNKTPIDIERKALAEREKIERGEVTLDVTRKSFDRSGELKSQQTSRYEVTFDGNKIRTIKNKSERYVFANNLQLSSFNHKFAYQRDLTTEEGRRLYAKAYEIDPRLLGIAPTDTPGFQGRHLKEVLKNPDYSKSKTTMQKRDGHEVVQIAYEKKDYPATLTVTFDPQKNSVLEASVDSVDYIDRIENQLKLYDEKFWYPETVRYTRSFNGKVISESLITVKNAVFNKPIDKDAFSFGGISLPAGTRVKVVPNFDGADHNWDGKELR